MLRTAEDARASNAGEVEDIDGKKPGIVSFAKRAASITKRGSAGNLDRASGGEVINILEDLNRRGITLVIVTHDGDIGQRAHRQIRMVDGRIESDEMKQTPP